MTQAVSPPTSRTDKPPEPRLVSERVAAPAIGVSVAFLQKDRRTKQTIPFVRIGDRCLYDLEAVFDALRQYQQGGPHGVRVRRR